jgi:taurine dioxygenase
VSTDIELPLPRIEPLGVLGALVDGVDLAKPLPDEHLSVLHRAWLDHSVLFFRGQSLTPKNQAAFAGNFGELDVYPFMKSVDDHPNVIPIIKEPDAEMNFGGGWHTDTSYLKEPPKATVLYALEVPEKGGDTLFANAAAAFDDLSIGMQRMLESMTGIYSPKVVHGAGGAYAKLSAQSGDLGSAYGGNEAFAESEVEHPLIRTHPETGRKSIYCSPPHTHRIRDMTREESLPILKFLEQHLTQERYVIRFKWQPGTLAMWDNRCIFHYAVNDYPGKRRHMHRVIVKGDRPR